MMLEFLETGKALYVLAAVCGLGLLGRLVARSLYKRLTKETDNMTLTKNRYLRDLKQKAENTYRLNQGINNSRVYLEKQLTSYRFLGMSLSGWGCFGGQMTILCFLLGGAAAFGAYWYRCDSYYIVLYGTVGILTGLATMVVDYWANLGERRQLLLSALQDYMENSLFNRLVRETASASVEDARRSFSTSRENVRNQEKNRRGERAVTEAADQTGTVAETLESKDLDEDDEDFEAQDLESLRRASRGVRRKAAAEEKKEPESGRRDVDYLKTSLEQIAASRERNRGGRDWIKDLSQDELEVVGQFLKQYLG